MPMKIWGYYTDVFIRVVLPFLFGFFIARYHDEEELSFQDAFILLMVGGMAVSVILSL